MAYLLAIHDPFVYDVTGRHSIRCQFQPEHTLNCHYEHTLWSSFSPNYSPSCLARLSSSPTASKLLSICSSSGSDKPCPGPCTFRSKFGLGQTRQPDYRACEAECEGGSREFDDRLGTLDCWRRVHC